MVSTTDATGAAATATGPPGGDDHAALRPPGDGGEHPGLGQGADGRVEARGAEEQHDLVLVGEEDLEVAVEQLEELVAVVLDAERVGQAQRHRRVVAMGDLDGLAHGRLGRGLLPEVALEVGDLGRGQVALVKVDGPEVGGHAEVGGHGALGVARSRARGSGR